MLQYYIASGILLILSTIDFAIAAPVLEQEKRQTGVDVMHIPEDVVTMLGKRVDELEDLFISYEAYLTRMGKPSSSTPLRPLRPNDGWTDVKQPLPPIPEMPSSASSQGHESSSAEPLTESGLMEENVPFGPFGPSSPASSSMSDADHELAVAHALPNPKPSTESSHEMHAPLSLSSQVFPAWFDPVHADYGMMGAHPSQARPNVDSSNRLVVEEPPSRSASPTESEADHEYQLVHLPSTNPGRRSMGGDSRLENLQAVSAVSNPFKAIRSTSCQ